MEAQVRNGSRGGIPLAVAAHAVALLAVCVLAAAPVPAPAQLVSFAAEATVFSIDDTHGLLDGSVVIDSPLHATIVSIGGSGCVPRQGPGRDAMTNPKGTLQRALAGRRRGQDFRSLR